MKNTYLTSHFPLFSIMIYSIALALYAEGYITKKLMDLGLYSGMTEFFSENGIKLTLLFLLLLFFFMVFSAFKIISDTTIQISLLFFSKDEEGNDLNKIRSGSWFYLISSLIALIFFKMLPMIIIVFTVATLGYFIFYIYKIRDSLTVAGLIGMVFFHMLFWFTFIFTVVFALTRLYNSFIASLPI